MARSSSHYLHKRSFISQKTFFVCIKIAINDTSGKSNPSRNKFIPTKTSNSPLRKSAKIFGRARVLISECKYSALIFFPFKCSAKASANRLVIVKAKTRCPSFLHFSISSMTSEICFSVERISISDPINK